MSLYTVILITGTLNSAGQPINVEKEPTSRQAYDLAECHSIGRDLVAEYLNGGHNYGHKSTKKSWGSALPHGEYIGYHCDKQDNQYYGAGGKPIDEKYAVILYDGKKQRGRSEAFIESDRDLSNNRIGNNTVSSVKVGRGCEVTLYLKRKYKGDQITLGPGRYNMARTPIGDDRLSSLRVNCGGLPQHGGQKAAVTLYAKRGFNGRSESLRGSDPDLGDNTIGIDNVSSVQVGKGCAVTLYAKRGYRGELIELRKSVRDMSATYLGNNRVRSVRVDCKRDRGHSNRW